MLPLLLFTTILLTTCTILGFLSAVSISFKYSKQPKDIERLRLQKQLGMVALGLIAYIVVLLATSHIPISISIFFIIDLLLLLVQAIIFLKSK